MEHLPVLIDRVIEFLDLLENPRFIVDATLGLGGYTEAILSKYPEVSVLGIDQDTVAIDKARDRLKDLASRVTFHHGNFRDLERIFQEWGKEADCVIFDLGVSNMQLVDGDRGFSYMKEGPLDMRMDRKSPGDADLTAAEVVNSYSAEEMTDIFRTLGEERYSRLIARGIVKYRQQNGDIRTTSELVNAIRTTLPQPVQRKMGKHPARRVFQALRIYVNQELEALEQGIDGSIKVCGDGGLIIAVSYHSLEDRIVKKTFRGWRDLKKGKILTKKPIEPSEDEIERNYKSRSAKMRVFRKTEMP